MTAKSQRQSPKPPHDASAEAKARLSAHLARTRCKHSRARDAIVDAFLATSGHVSIEELTRIVRRRAPGVGHTTVYRALKLLAACGLAAAREFGDGHARYERVLEGTHHDHLICTECGAIVEFEEPEIEELQEDVARRYGFQIARHKMELYGRCARCISAGRGSISVENRGNWGISEEG